MVDYVYLDGAKYLPSDEEVKKMRAIDWSALDRYRPNRMSFAPAAPRTARIGMVGARLAW